MKRIQVGVVGTGFIGPVHIEGLQRNSGLVEVVAVADSAKGQAEAVASRFGISQAYNNYQELLDNPAIQSVHICSPNFLHYPMVKKALERGKHVVCEKPFALTKEEGLELVQLARQNKLHNGVHFNLRYYPLIQNLRTKIAQGDLGDIISIQGGFLQDWLLYQTDYNWRLELEKSGKTRVIGDLGSHWIDLIEFLTGKKIASVCADFATVHTERIKPRGEVKTFEKTSSLQSVKFPVHTEDYANIMFTMEKGVRGSATFSQVAAGRKCYLHYEINGTKASAIWNSENPNHMWFGQRDGYNNSHIKDPASTEPEARRFQSYPGGHQEGFGDTSKQYCKEFYTAIVEGTAQMVPNFSDGLREIEICDAILQSAREHQWITI